MVRKSNYDTSAPDRPKPALWKVIKIFLQLKAEELKEFSWNALCALLCIVGILCAVALIMAAGIGALVGFVYCAGYVLTFIGHITHWFLNLIGHHSNTEVGKLGGFTILATMVLLAVLIAIVWCLHWIRDNWIKAKRLAMND